MTSETSDISLLFHQDFYEDIFEELSKFGELENLNVCDNMADHMVSSAQTHVYMLYASFVYHQSRFLNTSSFFLHG